MLVTTAARGAKGSGDSRNLLEGSCGLAALKVPKMYATKPKEAVEARSLGAAKDEGRAALVLPQPGCVPNIL